MSETSEDRLEEKVKQWDQRIMKYPALYRGTAVRAILEAVNQTLAPHDCYPIALDILKEPLELYDDAQKIFKSLHPEKDPAAYKWADARERIARAFPHHERATLDAMESGEVEVLRELAGHTRPYKRKVNGEWLHVLPGVFYYWDSKWMAEVLADTMDARGKTVLDLGTGTGVLGLVAGKQGAKEILLVDCSAKALDNAFMNFCNRHYRSRVSTRQTIPDSLRVQKKDSMYHGPLGQYDIIVANIPYFPFTMTSPNEFEQAVCNNHQHVDELPGFVQQHLTPDGVLYLGIASFSHLSHLNSWMHMSDLKQTNAHSISRNGAKFYVVEIRKGLKKI